MTNFVSTSHLHQESIVNFLIQADKEICSHGVNNHAAH